MIRLLKTSFLLSLAAVGSATSDNEPISLDDIEEAKSARLMKNKEDIDVQSTFHEHDIRDTGNVPDEYAARLVKNRGPITAKITASGSHNRYCNHKKQPPSPSSQSDGNNNNNRDHDDDNCTVRFSLVAWKFAGDEGTVHGEYQETQVVAKNKNHENDGVETTKEEKEEEVEEVVITKMDVDCLLRDGNDAIVGGTLRKAPSRSRGSVGGRAYVRVVDDDDDGGDRVSGIIVRDNDGLEYAHCTSPGLKDEFDEVTKKEEDTTNHSHRVSVCSKHGDWEECLKKAKVEVDRAIE